MTHFRKRARPKNSIFWGVCPTKKVIPPKNYTFWGVCPTQHPTIQKCWICQVWCVVVPGPPLKSSPVQRWPGDYSNAGPGTSGDYKQRWFHRGPWANVRRARERDSPRIDVAYTLDDWKRDPMLCYVACSLLQGALSLMTILWLAPGQP